MKKAKSTNILRFFPFTKGFRHNFIIALLSVIVAVVANYMTPQVIKITVDSVIGDIPFNLPSGITGLIEGWGGREFLRSNIIICAISAVFFAVISGLFNYLSRMNLAWACEGTIKKIRDRLFDHIQRLPFKWHNKYQTGDIIQRCTQDVNIIRNFVSDQMIEVIRTVVLIAVSFVMMFSMNFSLSMIVLCFMPVLIVSSLIFYVITAKRFKEADEKEGALTSVVQENLTGVRVVRAFGKERYEIDKFKKENYELTDMWVKLGKVMVYNWVSGDFLAELQVLVVMVIGVLFVVDNKLTVGEFLAFVSYNSMIVWPARNLGRLLAELSKTSISSARLYEILDAEEEKDVENSKKPPIDRDIEFKNVSFRYSEETPVVLKNVSFSIKAGTVFGILGLTGSGKSTLMHLLDRLYELPAENGEITIGGVDINEIELSYLRKNIGIVLQEPFLFSKSFSESIAEGSSNKSIDNVRKYAKMAVIDDAITGFSNGYETPIGERGVTISGGQKQRVAIARMLMQETPIKIFDDSLSAVDMETDARIRKSINENVTGTTILIAHRITTLMNAAMIMVLDKGEVSQLGTHKQLISEEGIYKKIYEAQKATLND
mgnify:CR=1 FL=1